jgi:hypothetical protein
MSNNKLFKDAIVDAKAIREAALLNAKEALEEALTPSIQNMLVAKLNEMDMDLDEEEYGMGAEEAAMEGNEMKSMGMTMPEEDEFDLSAILAELEAEEMEEGLNEAKEEEEEEETEEEEEEETEEEEVDVKDMSIEDLKDLIKDIVSQELEAEGMEMSADEEEEEMDMDMDMDAEMGDEMGDEEEINLEELLAELDALDNSKGLDEAKKKKVMKKVEKEDEKTEMKEAISVINTLRRELNEVNLLNAKLLYVNKIFKSKNLSESQKLNVIASFDKATTPKEAKMVFESLSNTLTASTKRSPIKESLGFASKAAGMAPKKQIVESNDVITRMQKLANIIK